MKITDIITEAESPAQQAAKAIAMKKAGKKPKQGVAEGSESDAYGNTGEKHECGSCDGTGIDTYDDECPECGGKGWVRDKESSKKKGVAEATGDEKFDTMMGQIQREPKYPDSQMPPTDVKDLYQWAVKNNKPYHKIFAEWANREGYKSVALALQRAGDLDTEALDYWTPRVWEIYWGEVRGIDSEMPPEWAKKRIPDELRDYLDTVFDAYDRIVFDWPTEYRQIGQQGLAEGYQLDESAIETITALAKKIPGIGKYYQMAQQYKPQLIEILKTSKSGKEVKQKMEQLAAGQSATVAESGMMKQLGGLAVGGGSILSTMWMNAMGMIDGVLAHAAAGEVGGAVASGSILGLIPVTLMLFAAMLMFKGSNQSSDEKAQAFQAQRGQQGVAEDTELAEEFDLIESIVEMIAEHNGVDAEVVWEDLESLTEDELYVFAVTSDPLMEDWQKANKRDKTDGMSQKAVNAYRRENPGSKLKTAVTTKPGKLKKGGKASKRRKSYCSRSRGQMKMHSISCAKTPDKAICKARRRWNC